MNEVPSYKDLCASNDCLQEIALSDKAVICILLSAPNLYYVTVLGKE